MLFSQSLLSLLAEAKQQDQLEDYPLGISCFDDLTYGQKISVLAIVGNGLLRKDVPSPELTAVVEGAIASVFEHLKNLITIEIDIPKIGTNWRQLVAAASREAEIANIVAPSCDAINQWEFQVDQLSERILWDVDYEAADIFADFPPEMARQMREIADITDNYYLAIAHDLTDEQSMTTIEQLQGMCESIINLSE